MSAERGTSSPSFANEPEAALESYRELGYHMEEDVWTPGQCEEIIQASKRFPSFQEGTFAPLMQPHRTNPVFLSAMRNPIIVGIMERLCAGPVSGLQSVLFFGSPSTPGFNMHQDNYVIESKPDAFATAWSAMQDVTAEMGGLVGYPGTHREPVLPVVEVNRPGSISQDPNATREEAALPDGYEGVNLFVPMGAALFMHSHFVHSSGTNRTDKFRRALVLTYIRSGEAFRPGFTAKREEVEVY